MYDSLLDFRSDTVTRPTPQMRKAMHSAPLGDDVLGDDPTVIRLQQKIAEMLGKEAALYVPSGTMSNLIGVRLHCSPGDELICEAGCHLYNYEQASYAQLGGIAARTVQGEHGVMQVEQLQGLVRPNDVHYVQTRLICLENTHNRGGGQVQPFETLEAICRWAKQQGLRTHLDGARLFNAVVASGIEASRWAAGFDTVSVCFSKGLGAPVGSALVGPSELIERARRHRKVLGGAMRQAGVVAAGALYALQHHIDRLADDHANARRLAEGIKQIDLIELQSENVDTNMVFFRVSPSWGSAAKLAEELKHQGLLILSTGPDTLRAVTHLDVDGDDVEQALDILKDVLLRSR